MKRASRWSREEIEIDLYWCIKVLIKRKVTFITAFLLFFTAGFAINSLFPDTYRISILLQPSAVPEALARSGNIESAESLKILIINGAFNGELSKRLNLDPGKEALTFNAMIPDKTDILQVGIDLEKNRDDFGVTALQNLADLISEKYIRQSKSIPSYVVEHIKLSEDAIKAAEREADDMQKEIKAITDKEDKLRKEIKALNAKTIRILNDLKKALKRRINADKAYDILFRHNSILDRLSDSGRMNDQLNKLFIRKDELNLKIRNIDHKINFLQMDVERLNSSRNFVPKLKILSHPRVSSRPVRTIQNKILLLMVNMGIFFGIVAVFLQEFWSNKDKKP